MAISINVWTILTVAAILAASPATARFPYKEWHIVPETAQLTFDNHYARSYIRLASEQYSRVVRLEPLSAAWYWRGSWNLFDFEDQEGWMFHFYIQVTDCPYPSEEEVQQQQSECKTMERVFMKSKTKNRKIVFLVDFNSHKPEKKNVWQWVKVAAGLSQDD